MTIKKLVAILILIVLGVFAYLIITDEMKHKKFKEGIRDYAIRLQSERPPLSSMKPPYIKGPLAVWVTGESFNSYPGIQDLFEEGGIHRIYGGEDLSVRYLVYARLIKHTEKMYQFEKFIGNESNMYGTGKTTNIMISEYGARVSVIDLSDWTIVEEKEFIPSQPPRNYTPFSGGTRKQYLVSPEEVSYRVMDEVDRWARKEFGKPVY